MAISPKLGVVAGLIVFLLSAGPAVAAGADPATLAFNQQKMLEFVNTERAARAIPQLVADPDLYSRAQQWAEKLAAERRGYHSPSVPAIDAGYASGAQNLAWGPTLNAAQAHLLWMTNSNDRRSLLDSAYSHAGIGIACSTASGRQFVVAVLELGGDAAPSPAVPPADPRVGGSESMAGRNVSCADPNTPSGSSLSGSTMAPPPPDPAAEAAAPGDDPTMEPTRLAQATDSGRSNGNTGVLATAVAALMAITFAAMKIRTSDARGAAYLRSGPRLNGRQVADFLEDYRLEE